MNDDIRELLSGAVPDLSSPDDRVAEVRSRANRLQRRRRSIAAGAAAVVTVAIATTLPIFLRGEPVEPFTADAGPTVACPPYAATPPKQGQGATGPVAQEGAVRATMCVYRPSRDGWETDTSVIDQGVDEVIAVLNALPDHDTIVEKHPEARNAGCTLSLRPQYRLRFEYPDGSGRTVDFAMNCGTVESGDVVRYGEITKALDAFTESYRAQGGTVPDPPWQW